MQKALQIGCAVLVLLPLPVAIATDREHGGGTERTRTVSIPQEDRGRVIVTGCAAEDSCRIDYRLGRNGEPVWVLRRQVP